MVGDNFQNQRIRVGVFMGGRTSEREVSLVSGRTVCDHLDIAHYQVLPLFQTTDGNVYLLPFHFLHRGKTTDFIHRLPHEAQHISWDDLTSLVDIMYIASHGYQTEDGILQGTLDVLGIPYVGSRIQASAIGMHKGIQKKILAAYGISVPADITITIPMIKQLLTDDEKTFDYIKALLDTHEIQYPYIVKPIAAGSSLGVSLVQNESTLVSAILHAAQIQPPLLQEVIIEHQIQGMEFSCVVLTNPADGSFIPLIPTEIESDTDTPIFDYEQKYMPGRAHKFTPPRISADVITRIQQTAVRVMHALGFTNIGRIDGFYTQDNIIITDPNTFSGMAPAAFIFCQAAELGMSHTEVINHLIETELRTRGMITNIHQTESQITMPHHKKRIAVLFGGASNEREISLDSGRNVIYKLSPHTYTPIPLFVTRDMKLYEIPQKLLVRNSTAEIAALLDAHAQPWHWSELKHKVDFVFNTLHGGLGENGGVQGILDMLEIPYNGSGVLASALCMDKYKTNTVLRAAGFDVPQHLLVSSQEWIDNPTQLISTISKTFTYPIIVKPHDDGCSVMVQKVHDPEQLQQALRTIFTQKSVALIEECIIGIELTVGVIGNETPRALPPSQAIAAGDVLSIEEKFLPGAGENQTPALLPEPILSFVQRTMERVYETVQCRGYARIDCFYQPADLNPTKQDRVIILEINTLPGLTPATCLFHQAAEIGLRPMEFIDRIIELGFEAHISYIQSPNQAITQQHP